MGQGKGRGCVSAQSNPLLKLAALALPHTADVTLGQLLSLSGPRFPHL